MWAIRGSAIITLVLLATYWVLRGVATGCAGVGCDIYILPSIALPIAVLTGVAITGALAISWARPVGGAWLGILILTTALGLFGPPVALAIFSNKPDSLVLIATLLFAQGPVAALVYTISEVPSRIP